MANDPNPLFSDAPMGVINIGVSLFADALRAQSTPCTEVQWTPPADGDDDLMSLLDDLL